MLSIGKMSQGQAAYYDDLARSEDYYLDGGEPPGKWFGSGAEEFKLSGTIESQPFLDLFAGELGGRKLVQNPDRRCPGWDLTFSAPKTVSVALSQADGKTANEIREAQQAAVEKALNYLEGECGITRRGKGGAITEDAKCVFATFEHGTSRAAQPHLHTHALLLNIAVRDDGTTGAIHSKKFYQHKMTGGAIYRAELAHQLEQRLGVATIREGFSFQVAGVDPLLAEYFSARRKEIEAKLAEFGASGAKASAAFALTTRTAKRHTSRASLVEQWKEVGREYEWSEDQLQEILGIATPQKPEIIQQLADLSALEAVEKLMEQKSYFTEKEAIRFAAEFSQGRGVGAEEAIEATRQHLKKETIVPLIKEDYRYFTTREHLELEKKMIRQVRELAEDPGLKVSEEDIRKGLETAKREGNPLTKEQEKALRHVLSEKGRISMVTGDAGTGKTTVLKPVAEALEAGGYEVRGLALAGKAAQGMEEGAGISSQTIASFLWSQERAGNEWNPELARTEFEAWVEEKRTTLPEEEAVNFNPVWTKNTEEKARIRFEEFRGKQELTDKTVLVIDEAAMVDTKSFAAIIEKVKEAGATLIGIGDGKQLQAITQGGAFIGMVDEIGDARLTEIFRQREESEKEAVSEMADGDVGKSLDHFAREGRLDISEDRTQAKGEMITCWGKKGIEDPAQNLMLAGTNLDVFELNQMAQAGRIEAGLVTGPSLKIGAHDFHRGDRIMFTKNHKGLGVKNGSFGIIGRINEQLGTLTVEVDGPGSARERTRSFSLDSYDNVTLGYAVTTHKAQGVTVENSFVLTDEEMTDREMSYVQVSRAKSKTSIFTTEEEAGLDLCELVRKMEYSRVKEMALTKEEGSQVVQPPPPPLSHMPDKQPTMEQ